MARNTYDTDGTADESTNPDDPDELSYSRRLLNYWLIVGIVSVVMAVLEILLIYVVHIKAAISISRVTGLRLFPVDKERAFITAGLARAALVGIDLFMLPVCGASLFCLGASSSER